MNMSEVQAVEENRITAKKKYAPTSNGLLEPLSPWLNDPQVSEIMLNRPQSIFVEKKGVMTEHAVPEYDAKLLRHLFQLIANENRQTLTQQTPLLSGSLLDGSRIQLAVGPTAKYPAFAIRRKVVRDLSLADYEANRYYQYAKPCNIQHTQFDDLSQEDQVLNQLFHDQQWSEFMKKAIEYKKNVVISGATSSGKTTYLNACLKHVDLNDRIILLEDTREVEIPHRNQVQLLASKGEQGLAKVTMQALVQCCLRLRPDRIILGEIRGQEILDFVGACSTGHEGSITSIHANSPQIAFMRMTQMYKQNNVPSMSDADIRRELESVIDVIIQVNKIHDGRYATSFYYKYMGIEPNQPIRQAMAV